MTTIATSGWVPLAQLLRPQGRVGELLAEPLSDLPDIFATAAELYLAAATLDSPAPDTLPTHIESHWFPTGKNAGRIVLKLAGCNSISEAEALAGQRLLISASALPTLDPDTFFVGDLIGCTLLDASLPNGPIPVATIVDVEFATGPDGRTRLEDAPPLLAVEPLSTAAPQGETTGPIEPILVPFVRAWLDSVDIPARRITMRLPEGLLSED